MVRAMAAAVLAATGCYQPQVPSCALSCTNDDQCPDTMTCGADFICHATAGDCPRLDTYGATILLDGPIAYWRLDERLDATIARDSIGLADGMYMGDCQREVAGAITTDPATFFDGASCFVAIPSAPELNFAGNMPYSVEAWLLPAGTFTFGHIFTRETRNFGPIDGYALFMPTEQTVAGERSVATDNVATAYVAVSAAFHHVVLTYDGSTEIVYVDGVADVAAGAPLPMTAFPVQELIGSATPTSNFFHGVIDEVAVYDYDLSQEQILEHFAAAH